jgi:hypothetical protein
MQQPNYIDYAGHVARAASDGSPAVVKAAGRLLGLGAEERDALARDGVPGWAWAVIGVGAGIVAGVRIYRRWPNKVPKLISGA